MYIGFLLFTYKSTRPLETNLTTLFCVPNTLLQKCSKEFSILTVEKQNFEVYHWNFVG